MRSQFQNGRLRRANSAATAKRDDVCRTRPARERRQAVLQRRGSVRLTIADQKQNEHAGSSPPSPLPSTR